MDKLLTWVSSLPRSTTTPIHPFVQYAEVTLLGISSCQCPIVKRPGVAYSCSYVLLLQLCTENQYYMQPVSDKDEKLVRDFSPSQGLLQSANRRLKKPLRGRNVSHQFLVFVWYSTSFFLFWTYMQPSKFDGILNQLCHWMFSYGFRQEIRWRMNFKNRPKVIFVKRPISSPIVMP